MIKGSMRGSSLETAISGISGCVLANRLIVGKEKQEPTRHETQTLDPRRRISPQGGYLVRRYCCPLFKVNEE
jgi:hypothetical protein